MKAEEEGGVQVPQICHCCSAASVKKFRKILLCWHLEVACDLYTPTTQFEVKRPKSGSQIVVQPV